MSHGPSVWLVAKEWFYIFKWLGEKSKEGYFITHDNYMKFKSQGS